ncbi:hypothetical protein OG275_38120 (plasmid) [Streptomyces niveus]|uniref:hypothetical protein n=1 Tax=Streptomyces niveus TaxID=193462 RepID=UPI002E30A821|nr:hypothetical protein [Streptomyces niveus]
MTSPLGRLAPALAVVLLLLVGLSAPSAAAVSRPAAVPATAPLAPLAPADGFWDEVGKCASALLPAMPKEWARKNGECVKKATGGTVDLHKEVLSAPAKAVANSVLGDAAESMAEFTAEFIEISFTWWLMTPSVQVKDSGVLGDPNKPQDPTKYLSLHAVMVGIGIMIAIMLTIFQGIRIIIQRKGAPVAQLIQGFLINALVSAAGVAIIDALLIASDSLTMTILKVAFGGDDAPKRMAVMLLPAIGNPMGLLAVALIALVVGGIQVVTLFLRQAAIPIQALLLPIAGSGQLGGESSRQWLPKLFTAIMVIITYKPMAALIIAVGFTEIKHGSGIIDFVRGIVTLVLSVVALKSLMALFAPLGMSMGNAVSSGGGLGGALSMVGGAMASQMGGAGGAGADGGGSTSAASHAAHMDRNGPAGGGGSAPAPASADEGNSAIQQAGGGGNIPQQTGAEAGASAAESGAAAGQTAAAGGSQAAAGTAAKAAGGPVTVALVAAEAAHSAVKSAGNTAGGKE